MMHCESPVIERAAASSVSAKRKIGAAVEPAQEHTLSVPNGTAAKHSRVDVNHHAVNTPKQLAAAAATYPPIAQQKPLVSIGGAHCNIVCCEGDSFAVELPHSKRVLVVPSEDPESEGSIAVYTDEEITEELLYGCWLDGNALLVTSIDDEQLLDTFNQWHDTALKKGRPSVIAVDREATYLEKDRLNLKLVATQEIKLVNQKMQRHIQANTGILCLSLDSAETALLKSGRFAQFAHRDDSFDITKSTEQDISSVYDKKKRAKGGAKSVITSLICHRYAHQTFDVYSGTVRITLRLHPRSIAWFFGAFKHGGSGNMFDDLPRYRIHRKFLLYVESLRPRKLRPVRGDPGPIIREAIEAWRADLDR